MPAAKIDAMSTSCRSSGVRAVSAQLVMVKNSAREWPPVVARVGSWPSLALLFTYRAEVRVGGGSIQSRSAGTQLKNDQSSLSCISGVRNAKQVRVWVSKAGTSYEMYA